MLKKIAAILSLMLLFMIVIPCYANANGPPQAWDLQIKVYDASPELIYMDVFVLKTLEDINIDIPNPEFFMRYPGLKNSDIINLEIDGYVSYSLYFKDAISNNIAEGRDYFKFAEGHLKKIKTFKIVTLDANGKILKISDTVSLKPKKGFYLAQPPVVYSYINNSCEINFIEGYSYKALILLMSLLRICLSIFIETMIAIPFLIRPIRMIILTNLITQVFISIGLPIVSIFFPYAICLVVFEILIVFIEYFTYIKFAHEPKKVKVFVYTLTANAVSLSLGSLLNALGVFTV